MSIKIEFQGKNNCRKDTKTNCSLCKERNTCSIKDDKEKEEINEILRKIRFKLVFLSGKGGVGKSTISAGVATTLASRGVKVGVLDLDFHGPSIPRILGILGSRLDYQDGRIITVKKGENLKVLSIGNMVQNDADPIVWRGPAKASMIKQLLRLSDLDDLDILIVDCPPGTGDEPISILTLLGADTKVVVITTPQMVSVDDVRRSISFCKKIPVEIIGIIENMSGHVCSRCGHVDYIFGKGGGERLSKEMNIPFLGSIPLDTKLAYDSDLGSPIHQTGSKPVIDAINEITNKIWDSLSSSKT